jgi:hypothetical protein
LQGLFLIEFKYNDVNFFLNTTLKNPINYNANDVLKLFLAIGLSVFAYLCLAYPEHLREYRLYFFEDRKSVDFPYQNFSPLWSESEAKAEFKKLTFRCYKNSPEDTLGQRSCFADIGAFNGISAMSMSLNFSNDRLHAVVVQSPWWVHWFLMRQMRTSFGLPKGYSVSPQSRTKFLGWTVGSGNALFVDSFQPINPLMWNTVLWKAGASCVPTVCFQVGN